MSDRATRPLNGGAAKAADNSLYQGHADDPRPNALYEANGSKKPLDPDDPEQAGLRQEWMDAYKANGGETEPADYNATPVDQVEMPCEAQKVRVDPVIVGTPLDFDETEDADEASPDDNEDDSAGDPDSEWRPAPDEEPADE